MTIGNNFSLSFNTDDEAQTQSIFSSLIDRGTVIMPFETVFWRGKFGMLLDKFGIQWMVSCNDGSIICYYFDNCTNCYFGNYST